MINKDSIKAAIALSQELSEKGLVAIARPNTVVSELVRLTNVDLIAYPSVTAELGKEAETLENLVDDFGSLVENLTTGKIDQPTLHDTYSDSAIDTIASAVTKHISFAKNTVKPIVVEYAESVKTYLSNFKPPAANEKVTINVCDAPELLEDEGFISTLDFYKNKSILKPNLKVKLSERSGADLLNLLLLGDKEADEAITAWYTRKGETFFLNVWENFFRDPEFSNPLKMITYDDILESDVFERADYGLAIYLMANKLFDAVDETTTGMSLNAYRVMISQTKDFAGATLANFFVKMNNFDNMGLIVISVDTDKNSANVYGKNYREWLKSGASVEIILGMIISGKQITSKVLLNENAENFLSKWKTFNLFHNASEGNKNFEYFKDALRLKFREIMSSMTEEEKSFNIDNVSYYDKVNTNLETEIKMLKSSDMDDIYSVALRLICRARFFYTDAEAILLDINKAALTNPEIDVREAALISTLNYVIEYIADQLALSSNY